MFGVEIPWSGGAAIPIYGGMAPRNRPHPARTRPLAGPGSDDIDLDHFMQLERGFGRLLELAAPLLSDAEATEVVGFLDAGEYGSALGSFIHHVGLSGQPVTHDVLVQVIELADRMAMRGEIDLDVLRQEHSGSE